MFECNLKNTYEIKMHNVITCINDNEVNNIAEYNLLPDILDTHKFTHKN